jgi:hypothetical protein
MCVTCYVCAYCNILYAVMAVYIVCFELEIHFRLLRIGRLLWKSSSSSSSSSWVICHTTGPQPLPKRFLHLMQSRASSFKWEYPILSPRSYSNFLRLLPRLLVTSIRPFIFPSITCFRRQFLRKIWPIQLAFRFLISCRIFLCSLTLSNTSFLTWSVQLIFSIRHIFHNTIQCLFGPRHFTTRLTQCWLVTYFTTQRSVHWVHVISQHN